MNIFLIFSSVNERFSWRWSGLSGLYENVSSFCKTSTLHITKSKKKKKRREERKKNTEQKDLCVCGCMCYNYVGSVFLGRTCLRVHTHTHTRRQTYFIQHCLASFFFFLISTAVLRNDNVSVILLLRRFSVFICI